MKSIYALAVVSLLLISCNQDADQTESAAESEAATPSATANAEAGDEADSNLSAESVDDWHSFANTREITIRHMNLDLTVDFDQQVLKGKATLELQKQADDVQQLHLDTRSLTINSVTAAGESLDWRWGEQDEIRGRELIIELPEAAESVTIDYQTSPQAAGLQWLQPRQTAGGEHPFLFTQSQAIEARSWIPLQDTPGVRFTYDAVARTPVELRATMSASNALEPDTDGVYEFSMPQPIPSYLMALGVGDLEFKAMSERTGVFAEPSVVDAAANEFADTEKMIEVGEDLFGEYRWGRYDLLILPPSFPYGGMENPRLSFITPTVIAGDRSLVALIAHELAHSWSGNLVTNATWEDFWLNEGFTVYLESRIMEEVYGEEREAMEAVLGYQALLDDFEDFAPADQRLAVELEGRSPDEVFSSIPYEKGRLLLVWMENAVGREAFDEFLNSYFDHFAFQSITTQQFLDYLDDNLISQYPEQLAMDQVKQWIYEPGLPEFAVLPESDAFSKVDEIRAAWLEGEKAAADLEVADWSVHEWLYFLNNMPKELSDEQLAALDEAFDLTTTGNNEIAHSWLRIAIRNEYQPAFERLREYLVEIGRRKLIQPLYEDLMETPAGAEFARDVYKRARLGYHPLAVSTMDEIVLEANGSP